MTERETGIVNEKVSRPFFSLSLEEKGSKKSVRRSKLGVPLTATNLYDARYTRTMPHCTFKFDNRFSLGIGPRSARPRRNEIRLERAPTPLPGSTAFTLA